MSTNSNNIINTNTTLISNSKVQISFPTKYKLNNIALPIKPRYYKLLNEVFVNFAKDILNYLTLPELAILRRCNQFFLATINDYYEIRLKNEISDITNFQNENEDKTRIYMQNIDSQIPLSNNQWLEFDLNKVINEIQKLDKNTISQLKSIKKLSKFNENIYAPFCLIFGKRQTNYKVRAKGWKKTADNILNDINILNKIRQLDYENFEDSDILEAFIYLNNDEMQLTRIKRYSLPFYNLIKWCQAVVSYHILIHPYIYRNKNNKIAVGSDVYKYAKFMDQIISKFYKFKRFLYKLGLVQIPLGDYVFNLQHTRELPHEKTDLSKIINVEIMGNILSYLSIEQSYKFINVNQLFIQSFKESLYISCEQILKEILIFKLKVYPKLYQSIPIIYENNIFGKYFLMLDDILNSTLDAKQAGNNFIPFLTKDHINDIRNLKTNNANINTVCKIFCSLFNIRCEKKTNQRGELVSLYTKSVKLLAVKGTLNKKLRYFNKLELNKKQLNILMNEIVGLYGTNKIQEIKKINKGIYQILMWELFLFEYLKEFNPFMFINIENYKANIANEEDLQMLVYYLDMINFLKYNLKFKYHFHSLEFNGIPDSPCYGFIPIITSILQEINNEDVNISPILDIVNIDKTKTANAYFDNKDDIINTSKPGLYQRIMEEIFNINEKLYLNSVKNENNFIENNKINTSEGMMNPLNNNLDMIREENNPDLNIGDNKILRKYLVNNNNYNGQQNMDIDENNNIYNNQQIDGFDILANNNNILNKMKNKFSFNIIPNEIIIKSILLYLDIKSIPPFALVNKKCNECFKINMYLRLLILDDHKNIFENENEEYITSIETKRNNFFTDYELAGPNIDHANLLMSQLDNQDITELKTLYRKYNKTNEKIISPLVLLFGEKPKINYNANGIKKINYFTQAQKILNDRKFNKKIREINLETISGNIFRQTENIMHDKEFTYEKMKGYSPCLNHLICWEMGVLEYHRSIRNFCLNYYDWKLLSKEEITFCKQMDNIMLMFNKLKFFTANFCQKYKETADIIYKNSFTINGENEEEEVEEIGKVDDDNHNHLNQNNNINENENDNYENDNDENEHNENDNNENDNNEIDNNEIDNNENDNNEDDNNEDDNNEDDNNENDNNENNAGNDEIPDEF